MRLVEEILPLLLLSLAGLYACADVALARRAVLVQHVHRLLARAPQAQNVVPQLAYRVGLGGLVVAVRPPQARGQASVDVLVAGGDEHHAHGCVEVAFAGGVSALGWWLRGGLVTGGLVGTDSRTVATNRPPVVLGIALAVDAGRGAVLLRLWGGAGRGGMQERGENSGAREHDGK